MQYENGLNFGDLKVTVIVKPYDGSCVFIYLLCTKQNMKVPIVVIFKFIWTSILMYVVFSILKFAILYWFEGTLDSAFILFRQNYMSFGYF